MYLKMMLGGQLLEQQPVQNANLYTGNSLQSTMTDMIRRHEATIDGMDDQPQFLLEAHPTQLPSKYRTPMLRKLAVFFNLV
jgi:hypothetical protein